MAPLKSPEYLLPKNVEIFGTGWPEPMLATPEAVRAAIYSGEASKSFILRVTHPDGWEIRANRLDDGWYLTRGQLVAGDAEFRAVPKGDRRSGKRYGSALRAFFSKRDFHLFSAQETLSLLNDFLEGDVELNRLDWMIRPVTR